MNKNRSSQMRTHACVDLRRTLIKFVKHITEKLPYYSWIRAMIELRGITDHERYIETAKMLSKLNCARILDVGSGGNTPLKQMGYKCLSLDVKREFTVDIVASALHLPFRDNVFDAVTAIDILEHLAISKRENAVNEMKRVGNAIIIHIPLQDGKSFMGRSGDLMFYNFTKYILRHPDSNTLEHLKCDHPTPSQLEATGFKIAKPDWNLMVWLITMKLDYISCGFLVPIITIAYLLLLNKIRNRPYWGAWLVYGAEISNGE